MEAWFISDIHLKDMQERNGQILLRFLHSLLDRPKLHLFLLGDIFDLWIGPHAYFGNKFSPLMEAIRQLKQKGHRVTYIEGNHDVHVEGYFQKRLGVEVHVEAQYYDLDGLRVRCEHGDLINLNDQAYLRYRSLIRNPYIKPIGSMLPGFFWSYIGNRASDNSRKKTRNYAVQNEQALIEMVREHIPRAYSESPFDLIISGHMHVFDDYSTLVQGRNVRSVNLGSWLGPEVRAFKLEKGLGSWITLT